MKKLSVRILSVIICAALIASALPFCASALTTEDGFEYTQEDSQITVTGYTGGESEIVIPSEIDSLPVTRIGKNAFYFISYIESVSLPDSLVEIGQGAFWGCSALTSVDFGSGVESIGVNAFFGTALESVSLPDSVTSLGERAFAQCRSLSELTLSESLTELPESVFYDCEALRAVTVPASVISIGEGAFAMCYELSSLKLGSNLKTVGKNAFHDCPCSGVVIPVGVEEIGEEAFGYCTDKDSFNTSLIDGFYLVGDRESAAFVYAEENGITFNDCAHSVTEDVVVKQPTCTEQGESEIRCTDCAKKLGTHYLDKLKHTYTAVIVPPTCTSVGYTKYVCEVCGESYIDENSFIPPSGEHHSFVKGETVPPTCEEYGYTVYICRICSYVEKRDFVEPNGHRYVEQEVIPPTCEEQGYTIYKCSVCSQTKFDNYTEPLNHLWDDGVFIKEPDCYNDGEVLYTCLRCNKTYTHFVEALGHNYEGTVTSPTCESDGYTTFTCTRCDDMYVGDFTDATGHAPREKITYPSYSVKGSAYVYCVNPDCDLYIVDKAYDKPYLTLLKTGSLKAGSQTTSSVKLAWSAVKGAEKYEVYNATTKRSVAVINSTSYTVGGLKSGTMYQFRVRALAGGNKGDYCSPVSVATKPSAVTLSSVTALSGRKVRANWKKVSSCSGYQVQYSLYSSFKNSKTVTASASASSATLTSLSKGKKYYVRVRAYKWGYAQKLYGAWSTVKSVKVK